VDQLGFGAVGRLAEGLEHGKGFLELWLGKKKNNNNLTRNVAGVSFVIYVTISS
jgi:hypothetical protein